METSVKSALAEEYFNFRLLQEQELYTICKKQNIIKNYLLKELKTCDNINVKRINNAITIFKKIPTKSSITVFDFIINDLNGLCKRHYETHKDQIEKYINGIFRLQDELVKFRKEKKKAFKKFKLSYDNIDLTMYNLAYIKLKSTLKAFKSSNVPYSEFKKLTIEYNFLEDVIEEYMVELAKDIDSKFENAQEEIYLEQIQSLFNLNDTKQSLQEREVLAILANMNIGKQIEALI